LLAIVFFLFLLGFPVQGVLTAETAILVELKTIGIVLLVLEGIVVPLLAFGAGKCDLYAHGFILLERLRFERPFCGLPLSGLPLIQPYNNTSQITPLHRGYSTLTQHPFRVKDFFSVF
jgi:hypothetical protein